MHNGCIYLYTTKSDCHFCIITSFHRLWRLKRILLPFKTRITNAHRCVSLIRIKSISEQQSLDFIIEIYTILHGNEARNAHLKHQHWTTRIFHMLMITKVDNIYSFNDYLHFASLSTISNPTAFFVIFLHILQLNVIHLYVLVTELPSPYGLGKFLPKYPVSFIYLFFLSRLHSFLISWYDSSLHHSIRLPFAGIVLFGTL